MKPTVYIETSVVSYLTAKPSRDIVVAANQQVTREWWEKHLNDFDTFISQIVLREAMAGDPECARKRLYLLKSLPILEINIDINSLVKHLIGSGSLPYKAKIDALHIATAAFYQINFLITWNCKHIANAFMRNKIVTVCARNGFKAPIICTPLELIGENPCGKIPL
ncbi:MAG: DNA-binding protein [Candidatus Omnitrophota bacterium]|jgi:predicted nucleic acid-binding protein|nr:MAG: DNA-binding protein [Candidatus Omnitrophota bacterium]